MPEQESEKQEKNIENEQEIKNGNLNDSCSLEMVGNRWTSSSVWGF